MGTRNSYGRWILIFCTAFILLPLTALCAGNGPKSQDPEEIGVFFYLDSKSNSLIPLERQTAIRETRGLIKRQSVAKLRGEKATVRLNGDVDSVFVIRLMSGVDPSKFKLYSFGVKKGMRELVLAESTWTGGSRSNPAIISCTISKFGESSFKFTPGQPLGPGEYGFSPDDSNEVFAFGFEKMDGAAGKSEKKKQN